MASSAALRLNNLRRHLDLDDTANKVRNMDFCKKDYELTSYVVPFLKPLHPFVSQCNESLKHNL